MFAWKKIDKTITLLVLIIPEMSGYVKTFKFEDKINKLLSFHIDNEILLKKHKSIWTNIEDLVNI